MVTALANLIQNNYLLFQRCDDQIKSEAKFSILQSQFIDTVNNIGIINGQYFKPNILKIMNHKANSLFADEERRIFFSSSKKMENNAQDFPESNDLSFTSIIGQSPAIRSCITIASKAARSNATVLLLGETGTGKEEFARCIHHASLRNSGPFIPINCAAIPHSLAESELFGYDDGAFTGAKKGGQPGKFELANRGTIFLDEIGDMPLSIQSTLLRVLQDRCLHRVGSSNSINVDVRVIAATNKNLQLEVDAGNFRQDLFYRLNVISINIPPLRERDDDLFLIIQHFLNKSNKYFQLSPAVEKIFRNYSWPGNVRELHNVLERVMNLADGNYILPSHLPPDITSRKQKQLDLSNLKSMEHVMIRNALRQCHGNVSKAAGILGISRNTLYRKIKRLGIAEDI
ncbi:hypothetical protein A6M21_09780 [Desulfotomaculum copahuensis]|uniref:Sigma-54 factor interaction domain-containing protein n=2 Tax=Desulfotomaculum copahuensis TaxID=1838280 RepID=A0A1B7LEI4_9FIRM|nr:hypothetical protein A6M21_09780 [Desulfotomaculum copahuensis]